MCAQARPRSAPAPPRDRLVPQPCRPRRSCAWPSLARRRQARRPAKEQRAARRVLGLAMSPRQRSQSGRSGLCSTRHGRVQPPRDTARPSRLPPAGCSKPLLAGGQPRFMTPARLRHHGLTLAAWPASTPPRQTPPRASSPAPCPMRDGSGRPARMTRGARARRRRSCAAATGA